MNFIDDLGMFIKPITKAEEVGIYINAVLNVSKQKGRRKWTIRDRQSKPAADVPSHWLPTGELCRPLFSSTRESLTDFRDKDTSRAEIQPEQQ
jgi:hypothetical protein